MRKISIIVAVDEDGGFGKDGKIPWHFPEDLKHFQTVTKDSVCIMGRNTYTDIVAMRDARKKGWAKKNKKTGKYPALLPNRDSYVVTHTLSRLCPAKEVPSISWALQNSDQEKDVFIIGGYRMFVEALSIASNIHMTIIPGSYDCDREFPIAALNKAFVIESGEERDGLKYMVYKRTKNFR